MNQVIANLVSDVAILKMQMQQVDNVLKEITRKIQEVEKHGNDKLG